MTDYRGLQESGVAIAARGLWRTIKRVFPFLLAD